MITYKPLQKARIMLLLQPCCILKSCNSPHAIHNEEIRVHISDQISWTVPYFQFFPMFNCILSCRSLAESNIFIAYFRYVSLTMQAYMYGDISGSRLQNTVLFLRLSAVIFLFSFTALDSAEICTLYIICTFGPSYTVIDPIRSVLPQNECNP